ncbi:uncharacterized protein G2W53_010992 [Senna tora]|uniref:Uncharacterized protein n=1 Tax=Senna tora TaxID=362788 RepID=A0A834X0Y5_9FABA|nr:uncharacterized protein G2W53_010992 [Senna tora]
MGLWGKENVQSFKEGTVTQTVTPASSTLGFAGNGIK